MANNNYVRFLRGSAAAYQALKDGNKLSSNTLYFISEANATTGKLYLGGKLIAGMDGSAITNLSQLTDVIVTGAGTGSFLVYDATDSKWHAKTATEVAGLIVTTMTGATATTAGTAGLVPTPAAGDQDKYLKGNGQWTDITQKIIDVLTAQLVPASAKESLDTLQEIAAWIQDHPDDASAMAQDITDLQNALKALQDALNDKTEGEGDSAVTTDGLITKVEKLYQMLTWVDLDNAGNEITEG